MRVLDGLQAATVGPIRAGVRRADRLPPDVRAAPPGGFSISVGCPGSRVGAACTTTDVPYLAVIRRADAPPGGATGCVARNVSYLSVARHAHVTGPRRIRPAGRSETV